VSLATAVRAAVIALVALIAVAGCAAADPEQGDSIATFRVADGSTFKVLITDPADLEIVDKLSKGEDAPSIPNGAIVRETGVLEGVARILEHQTTPYRQVRELGEEIPLTSRIIKVVNAYEDLNRGARGMRSRDAALERIYLGLGYEYDPSIVDALLRALELAPHHSEVAATA